MIIIILLEPLYAKVYIILKYFKRLPFFLQTLYWWQDEWLHGLLFHIVSGTKYDLINVWL
jgi:hypothetical protein